MEYKYEPIFGDQSLFDGAPDDAEYAGWFCQETRWYMILNGKILFSDGGVWSTSDSPYLSSDIAAMRRIINPPVWTKADEEAGKLPEVGCKVFVKSTSEVGCIVALNNNIACILFDDGAFVTVYVKSDIKPIESQEEKAARLEDEWISAATSLDESPVLTDNAWRRIYRLQLSGDLPVPVKGE